MKVPHADSPLPRARAAQRIEPRKEYSMPLPRLSASALASSSGARYSERVAETTAARSGKPEMFRGGQPPLCGFFTSVHLAPSMVGPWWGCVRARRFPRTPVFQPRLVPDHPSGNGSRVLQPVRGGRTMRSVLPARPEPSLAPAVIINRALRDAALAPSDAQALDIAGDALRQLAMLCAHGPDASRRLYSAEQSSTVEVRA